MRERTTWNANEILKQGAVKTADPYTMNQDHPQPAAGAYVTGDPSSFAEDVAPNNWSTEYSGGQVKRNEIGMPELRGDTYNHPEKTAALNTDLLVKKADLCAKVARLMLAGRRFASAEAVEAAVEDQAVAMMNLADSDLIDTYSRMSQEQEQAPAQQEQVQAQQQEEAPAPAQQQQAQAQQQVEQEQAPAPAQQQQAQQQMMALASQAAKAIKSGDQRKVQAAVQGMVAQALKIAKKANEEQEQQGQPQSVESMVQDMVQQAMGQQDQGQMAPPAQQQTEQQAQLQTQQMPMANDDQLLDDMLGDPGMGQEPGMDMDMGIEMEPAPMDVGEVGLEPEDDVLRSLFANQETQDAEEAQQMQQGGQAKQASIRTAATRTVGTRPVGGVSRIGGGGSAPSKGAEDVNRLSSLWQTAPDVRDAFGLK